MALSLRSTCCTCRRLTSRDAPLPTPGGSGSLPLPHTCFPLRAPAAPPLCHPSCLPPGLLLGASGRVPDPSLCDACAFWEEHRLLRQALRPSMTVPVTWPYLQRVPATSLQLRRRRACLPPVCSWQVPSHPPDSCQAPPSSGGHKATCKPGASVPNPWKAPWRRAPPGRPLAVFLPLLHESREPSLPKEPTALHCPGPQALLGLVLGPLSSCDPPLLSSRTAPKSAIC